MGRRCLGLVAAVWLAFGAGATAAENGRLQGRVVDAATNAPLAKAAVTVDGTAVDVDASGRFTVERAAGTWVIVAGAPGHENVSLRRDVRPGENDRVEIALPVTQAFQETVEVVATESSLGTAPATLPVRPNEVTKVAGAMENVFRVIHTLPGVAAVDELSSRVSVRGGGPDQNLTVMDGVEIHNPYRIWGFVSAFNPETIESFDLSTGAFSARYGDRLSSVLTVLNRSGSTSKPVSGSGAMSLTDGNFIAEGALPKGAGSFLLTARRTWYDVVAGQFTDNKLPRFGDLQGKAVLDLGRGRSLSLFGIWSRESSDLSITEDHQKGALDSKTGNSIATATLQLPLGPVFSRTTAAVYDNDERVNFGGEFRDELRRSNAPSDDNAFSVDKVKATFDSTVRDLSVRQELLLQLPARQSLELGGEMHRLQTDLDLRFSQAVQDGSAAYTSLDPIRSTRRFDRYGAWLIHSSRPAGSLEVDLGLRFDRAEINGRSELWPRLAATWHATPRTRLRAAFGVHTQSPGYEKLSQADYLLDFSKDGRLTLDNERATHVVGGIERDLGRGVSVRVEGFWKAFDDLIVGRLETPQETAGRIGRYDFPAELEKEIPREPQITSYPSNGSSGRAYGFDLFLSRASTPSTRLSGWASYTYTVADRKAYGLTFPFQYEQRHALSLVGTLRLTSRLQASLTGRFSSGFPVTTPVGLRVAATSDPEAADPETARLVPERDAEGRLVYAVDYGPVSNLYQQRLTAFARLDGRVAYRPSWGRGRMEIYVDLINILNRANGDLTRKLAYQPGAERPAVVEERKGSGLPFFPSFGIHYRF